ncbi:MAG: DUF4492 domain-containing protein [Bacteroidales bacterium]
MKGIRDFYYEGFRSMEVGKRLWVIILVKLFILFFVLRLFFFPDFLKSKFRSFHERSDYVGKELIERQH